MAEPLVALPVFCCLSFGVACATCPSPPTNIESFPTDRLHDQPLRDFVSCLSKVHLDARAHAASTACSGGKPETTAEDLVRCAGTPMPSESDLIGTCAS